MEYQVGELGEFRVIHIFGDIKAADSAVLLDDMISQMIDAGHHHFLFNLEGVSFLASSAIGIFIHTLADVQENNGSVYIISEDDGVAETLRMMGLDKLIRVYYDVGEFKKDRGIK